MLSNLMCYKDYWAVIELDDSADQFHGRVIGINDVVDFYGSTPEELRINPQTIYQSANQLGDELAPEMATAGKKLDDSDSAGPWYRSGSEIGVGSWGAYSEYSAASTLLQHEIEDTMTSKRHRPSGASCHD